jgi:sigma-E factor negative regulatory protein RseB
MVPFRVFILSLFLGCGTQAWSSDTSGDARMWLDRMSMAVKKLNYEGIFVYIHGNQLEAMQIVHRADDSGEQERLFSLVGTAREILRDNKNLTCILPDSKSVVVEKSRPRKYIPAGLLEVTGKLMKYYDFQVLGDDRMTGMPAKVIAVLPKDPFRYGFRLWLDKKTGMLLKSDLVDDAGNAVEQMMFTSIKIRDDITANQLSSTIDSKGYTWFRQRKMVESDKPKASDWKVTRVPGGFRMGMQKTHSLPTSRMPVEHFVYTDGISSVSVFIEKQEKNKSMLQGLSSMGAVNAYGTVISGHTVTVVGEVPRAAVKMIGDSVRYQPGKP